MCLEGTPFFLCLYFGGLQLLGPFSVEGSLIPKHQEDSCKLRAGQAY